MIKFVLHFASILCVLAVTSEALRSEHLSMKRTTCRMLSIDELLDGVVDTPVTTKRPIVLNNIYFGLRHGESEANKLGIISSDPTIGCAIHGLTPVGKYQARCAATSVIELTGRPFLPEEVIFVTSPFTRAMQTTDECQKALLKILEFENSALFEPKEVTKVEVVVSDKLRERYFGELDATPLVTYNYVWPVDAIDSENKRRGVESVSEVVERILSLVNELERKYSKKKIVFSSHADTLQIAQTFLSNNDPRKFSQYRFKNGEVRFMAQLPTASPLVYKSPDAVEQITERKS